MFGWVRSVGAEPESLHLRLRHRKLLVLLATLLLLLTPPVRGQARRLVHIQHLDHEQQQQADTGMEEFASQPAAQPADIGAFSLSRYGCDEAHCLHVPQQDEGGYRGEQERIRVQ